MVATAAKRVVGRSTTMSPERGLDWLNLFVGNIQTGFGPFIAVYLTTQGWTQTSIGLALSLGTIAAMISQMLAGALVDTISTKTGAVLFSILAFSIGALLCRAAGAARSLRGRGDPQLLELHPGAGDRRNQPDVAGPAMLGLRFGRNARFASIGNGSAPR